LLLAILVSERKRDKNGYSKTTIVIIATAGTIRRVFRMISMKPNLGLFGLDHLMVSGRRSPGLLVRLIGHLRRVSALHHALRGGHLDAARQHGGLAQHARGDRVPADVRPPVHLLGLVVGPGQLGGQVPFGVHGLQVTHVVVAFPGALYEQPAAAAARPGGRRRRRRHLLGRFGEPVHDGTRPTRSRRRRLFRGSFDRFFFRLRLLHVVVSLISVENDTRRAAAECADVTYYYYYYYCTSAVSRRVRTTRATRTVRER